MFENDFELMKKWPEYCLKKADRIEIMWLELKAHNHQHKIKQNTSTVLELFDELMSNNLPKELKCRIIITTAYIILHSNCQNSLKSVIDVLEDHIRKLEKETLMEKNTMPLMLGNLYYANFMCLLKHLQNLVCKELNSYTEERIERGMEQQNTIHYEPMSWILPLKIKPKLFSCLNLAVKYWSILINDTIMDEYDLTLLYGSLQEVAVVFKLHFDSKEVEVWQLLYKLASQKKCHKYIFLALSELIKIGKTNVSELDNVIKHLPKMAINYKLTLITSLLNQSKFKDAQMLLEAIDVKELNNNVLIMADYSYLKSRLYFESEKCNSDKCLSILFEAYNLAHGLIKRLDSFYEYLVMHFIILNICSYLNLIYLNTLKPVEARCFLKIQMNIVLKSVLTKRALNVFIMNCWNELICYNFENASGQLEHVMTLLDFKEDELDSKLQQLTINHGSNIKSSPLSDSRCMTNQRKTKMASPSLKRLNNTNTQINITEFIENTLSNVETHDPIIIYSVIEACILKAVYCSKISQQQFAENYFKLVFKLLELSLPDFNKNEVFNILTTRQKAFASYHYAEHLILFNKSFNILDYIEKAKKSCNDGWLLLNFNELCISFKMNVIMKYPNTNVIHSPEANSCVRELEFKTPATTKIRVNTKSQHLPRFVTPTVRKLKMNLESPGSKENKLKSPLIRETDKIKKDFTAKKKIGKENIKSTTKDTGIKVGEKRSTKKKENIVQPSLIIKTRSNRLNI